MADMGPGLRRDDVKDGGSVLMDNTNEPDAFARTATVASVRFARLAWHWSGTTQGRRNMAEIEYPEPHSSLGERLLVGVRNLWSRVRELEASQQRTDKVVDHQGGEIEQIRGEIQALRREIHGLRVSRGRALAKNTRLSQQIAEAESGLSDIERQVH
jgi:chromosome segregation ATPase